MAPIKIAGPRGKVGRKNLPRRAVFSAPPQASDSSPSVPPRDRRMHTAPRMRPTILRITPARRSMRKVSHLCRPPMMQQVHHFFPNAEDLRDAGPSGEQLKPNKAGSSYAENGNKGFEDSSESD